jgi:hypothetical protein
MVNTRVLFNMGKEEIMNNYEYEWQIVYPDNIFYYNELSEVDWETRKSFGKFHLRLVRYNWGGKDEIREASVINGKLEDRFDLDLADLGGTTPLVPNKFHNELNEFRKEVSND